MPVHFLRMSYQPPKQSSGFLTALKARKWIDVKMLNPVLVPAKNLGVAVHPELQANPDFHMHVQILADLWGCLV